MSTLPSLTRLPLLCLRSLFASAVWFALIAMAYVQSSVGQEPKFSREQFAAELSRLAEICERLGLSERKIICENWLVPTADDREILYLPEPGGLWIQPGPTSATKSWGRHFSSAKRAYAVKLAEQLPEIAKQDEQAAYRLLWRVLRNDPEHEIALRAAGTMAKGPIVRPRLTQGRVPVQDFGWKARTYSRVDSPHFTLLTRADAKSSRRIAQQLEQFYVLWSQVFYPLWAAPGILQSRLEGKGTPWPRHERLRVVLLKDRSEYLRILGVAEDNIGVSVGYYAPDAKTSFFYPAENLEATLFHELTHQLLMEASSIRPTELPGKSGGIWMLEGIALYMESLRERHHYWTLGGWDAARGQTARYRAVRDGYWPEWDEFTSAGLATWKTDPDITRLYTHAAGVTAAFMHHLGEDAKQDYLKQMVGIYQGQNDSDALLSHLGKDHQAAKKQYQNLQVLTHGQMDVYPTAEATQTQDLVLTASQLTTEQWKALNRFTNLEWLDVSFSNVQTSDLKWVADAKSLKRLSVEGTAVLGEVVEFASKVPALEELDLSGCAIGDDDLQPLRGNRSLQTLWLTQTRVTPATLALLKSMPNLATVDVSGSAISNEQWLEFVQANPRFAP